jgi:RND family efflux transporter MFP subunit
MISRFTNGLVRAVVVLSVLAAPAALPALAQSGGKELSDRAKARDANKNGVIDRDEAGGPLAASFDEIDCDESGALDGAEIRGFFSGEGCPATAAAAVPAPQAAAPAAALPPLSDRAKERDKNKNGVIDRDEAGGPLDASFDEIDCDKSGALDGNEIRGFFSGEGCPKPAAASAQAAQPAAPSTAPAKPAAQRGPGGGERSRAVRVDKIVIEPLSQTYPVIGRLAARRGGQVAARINGAVSEMRVNEGDRVKEGDVIAMLAQERLAAERDKYQAAYRSRRATIATAEAELAKVQQELRRIEGLKNSAAFSRAKFEDLQRDVETRKATLTERRTQAGEAEAELKRAEIDLYNATIRAPYSGIISDKHTEVGAYVSVGAPVVSMISDMNIEIEAEVPTDRVAGLEPGTLVRFRLDDGTRHSATVRAVIPQENVRTRTRPVRFTPQFGDATKPFAINQSVTLEIPVGRARNVATVHKDAIVRRGDKTVVYIVRNDRAFPRDVVIGEAVGNRYIVVSGVEPGNIVVTHGNETLPPASRVEIYKDANGKPVGQ